MFGSWDGLGCGWEQGTNLGKGPSGGGRATYKAKGGEDRGGKPQLSAEIKQEYLHGGGAKVVSRQEWKSRSLTVVVYKEGRNRWPTSVWRSGDQKKSSSSLSWMGKFQVGEVALAPPPRPSHTTPAVLAPTS